MNVDPFVSAIATGLPPMSLGGGTANMGAPFGSLTAQSVPNGSSWSVITQ